LGFKTVPHLIHDGADWFAGQVGVFEGAAAWLANAFAAAIAGLIIGGIIVVIVRQFTSHPEKYVVDA